MTKISRDPFARTELHRRLERRYNKGCDNCGYFRSYKGTKTWNLFRYYTKTDGGTRHDHEGLFCSKSCHDSYHA